jgi:thiamine transport system substrate-binding protein
MQHGFRGFVAALAAGASAVSLAACSAIGDTGSARGSGEEAAGTVVLVTHDSFAVDKAVMRRFERRSGIDVEVVRAGDAGTVVNQLVLTKDSPLGDAVFGIDNAFATRALNAGVLAAYEPPATPRAERLAADESDRLAPVDFGDVCVNVDRRWFADRGIREPRTLEDLTAPRYADLLVVSNPATSSPGLSFLLATIGAYGEDGWRDYWERLRDNGLSVVDSWSDAYFVDFSGSSGKGPRPLVVSYASSPPAEVSAVSEEPPTRALLDTCFRQVEYAGVLANAANPEGAREVVDFLLSTRFQQTIPTQMYMYPVDSHAELPATWKRYGPLSDSPFRVDADLIEAQREDWITQWTDIVVG